MQNRRWDLYGYVIASRYRKKILVSLSSRPKTPSQLARENDLLLTRISNTLTDLTSKELIVCINPNRRKGRMYKLTEKGEKIAQMLSKEEES